MLGRLSEGQNRKFTWKKGKSGSLIIIFNYNLIITMRNEKYEP